MKIVAVLAIQFLQRFQAIGGEARGDDRHALDAALRQAPSRSRPCRASAIPPLPKRDWKLMRKRSSGQPKASRISRQVFTHWQW